MESKHCQNICVAAVLRRFPEALWLVRSRNDETASGTSASARGASGATLLDNAVLSKTKKHDVMRYIEAAVAHT